MPHPLDEFDLFAHELQKEQNGGNGFEQIFDPQKECEERADAIRKAAQPVFADPFASEAYFAQRRAALNPATQQFDDGQSGKTAESLDELLKQFAPDSTPCRLQTGHEFPESYTPSSECASFLKETTSSIMEKITSRASTPGGRALATQLATLAKEQELIASL